jgi:hypothetical protein
MKTKILVLAVLSLLTFEAYAENVFFKTSEVNGKITASGINLTDWQAVMSCHFDYKGSRKESIRYPQTWVKKINDTEYSLKVTKGSLSEFAIPGWRLLTCAYKLILIGKRDQIKTAFGEIYLLGQENGEMDPQDLKDIQNKEWVDKVLADKTMNLELFISPDGGITSER